MSWELADEVRRAIAGSFDGLRVPIANYFHAHLMVYGGWQEHPTRLWRRGAARYTGVIHERPRFSVDDPRIGDLRSPLHHFTHRSVIGNLNKSANYVEVQARALLASGAPPVTRWQLYRTLIREIGFRRCFGGVRATEWLECTRHCTGRFRTCAPRLASGSSSATPR